MCNDVERRFGNSAATYEAAADVQRRVALRLSDMVLPHLGQRKTVFEFGCGTGLFSRLIACGARPAAFYLNDLSADMLAVAKGKIAATCSPGSVIDMVGDAEVMPWPSADAVLSASAVQWFNSPLSAVRRASEALRPGGIISLATYGPLTFRELREGLLCSYPSPQDWELELKDCGFQILAFESFLLTQSFASRMALLRMVVRTGVGSRGEKQSASALHGECRLTWQPIMFVARLLG